MEHANGFGPALPDGTAPPGLVLIVDDNPTSATTLELACSGIRGVEARAVASALEAVRLLKQENGYVSAVVTDVRMPFMDGFQLLEFIRAHPRYSAMPVVVVSADTDPRTPELMSRLGANAFFSKPFSPAAVRRTLERLLHEKQTPNRD